MKHFIVIGLAIILLVGSFGIAADKPEANPVVSGNNAFACDLYAHLAGEKGNLFFSPYSISTALAMTYAGARGQTATEMAKTLHFRLNQQELPPAFARLLKEMDGQGKDRPFEMHVGNALARGQPGAHRAVRQRHLPHAGAGASVPGSAMSNLRRVLLQ
jgi:serpin B